MPDARLARARQSLPADYQFPTPQSRMSMRFVREYDIVPDNPPRRLDAVIEEVNGVRQVAWYES